MTSPAEFVPGLLKRSESRHGFAPVRRQQGLQSSLIDRFREKVHAAVEEQELGAPPVVAGEEAN
jgi:hypothetical protein